VTPAKGRQPGLDLVQGGRKGLVRRNHNGLSIYQHSARRRFGDPTLADGILDRLVHNAHRIEMRGDSMRKNRGKPNT
jgi:DNA replication protein DnaC